MNHNPCSCRCNPETGLPASYTIESEPVEYSGCGVPDDGAAIEGYRPICVWDRSKTTLTYRFVDGFRLIHHGDQKVAKAEEEIEAAITTWGRALGERLRFERTSDSTPDIIFSVQAFNDNRCKVAWVDAIDCKAPVSVVFNDQPYWSDQAEPSKYDIQTVALHEMGHVIGFGHSSSCLDSVMHSDICPNTLRRELLQSDWAGLKDQYGVELPDET